METKEDENSSHSRPTARQAGRQWGGGEGGRGRSATFLRPVSGLTVGWGVCGQAAKASRSSRCYAPLPYQLKRLFFR